MIEKLISILILILLAFPQLPAQEAKTDIFNAARNGDTEVIQEIADKDPSAVNLVNNYGHTSLIIAAYNHQVAAVNLLIELGANINYSFSQGSAIHGAAYKGDAEVAKILIMHGIDVNVADANGSTPLIYATLFNHFDVAKLLFESGADADHRDNTGNSARTYATDLANTNLTTLFNSDQQ